jgi:hypothetical protein
VGAVPGVDLGLQAVALGQQAAFLGARSAHDGVKAGPEGAGWMPVPGSTSSSMKRTSGVATCRLWRVVRMVSFASGVVVD